MAPPRSIENTLKALRHTYAQALPEDLRQIDSLWLQLQEHWDGKQLPLFHRMVHNIAGSGATFGFNELSKQAQALEGLLKVLLKCPEKPPSAASILDIERLLSVLRRGALEPE